MLEGAVPPGKDAVPSSAGARGGAPALLTPGQRISVRVPATSANLGPGFDSLGLALGWYDTLTLETAEGKGLELEIHGMGEAQLPRDSRHLSVRCIDAFLDRYRYQRGGLRLIAHNSIPHGRGLGSSAATIVAALLAARQLIPEGSRPGLDEVFAVACEFEGHPDNVASALYGGLLLSWQDDASPEEPGKYVTTDIPLAPGLRAVVAVPEYELATHQARSLLPESVEHRTAAANAGRAALLVHALSSDPSLLLPATRDYLHQEWRAKAMPESAALLRCWRDAGVAAVISGAGPTVLALADGPHAARHAIEVAEGFLAGQAAAVQGPEASGKTTGSPWRVREVEIESKGAKIITA